MDELNAIASLYSKNASKSSDGTVLIEGRILTNSEQVAVDAEVIRLQAEYDAQEYARNRAAEYPSIAELTIALYDTDDRAAIDAKRAEVKAKYPKPS